MKAHICIGGPLDGEHAVSKDFWRGGMYEHLRNEYAQFNNASSVRYSGEAPYSAVAWIHKPLLKPSISPRKR